MGAEIGPAIGAAGSLAGGLLGKKSADSSNEANLEAAMINKGPWSGAEPYIKQILGDAQKIYGDQGFAPDPNLLELLGRYNSLGYAEGTLPGLIASAQGSWMQGLDPGLNPWADRMVAATNKDLTQQFAREVLPRISDEAISMGGLGGGRQGVAQGLASEGLMEAMGDANTQIRGQAYRDMLGHQQAAWGQMGNMLNAGFLPSDAQQRVGGQYRQDHMLPGAEPSRLLRVRQSLRRDGRRHLSAAEPVREHGGWRDAGRVAGELDLQLVQAERRWNEPKWVRRRPGDLRGLQHQSAFLIWLRLRNFVLSRLRSRKKRGSTRICSCAWCKPRVTGTPGRYRVRGLKGSGN